MRGAATVAVVTARVQRQVRQIIFLMCAAALFAALELHAGDAAQAIGSAFFGSLAGIYLALMQRGGRMRELELCEQSAPLYGRELARAVALAPCAGATLTVAAYWSVAVLSPGAHAWAAVISLACANAATLIALCATLREGAALLLYLGLSTTTAIAIVAIEFPQPPAAFLLCAIAGFIALRQYGESLARYDPIPSA